MNRLLLIILFFIFFAVGCDNKRIVELPEIKNSTTTQVLDVSPAYIFYDKTKPDSVELNRKNLIITTNWLVNVDKRLKLWQAIPKIKFIQDKKRNAKMHKNEAAKNYFTCNNTSIKNLGFIDFTDVYYHLETVDDYTKNNNIHDFDILKFNADTVFFNGISIDLNDMKNPDSTKVFAKFDKNMTFQEYISYKEQINQLESLRIILDNDEFIY